MSANTRAKHDLLVNKQEPIFSSGEAFDTVCGEITLSLNHDDQSTTIQPDNDFDTFDTDIKSHITSFLNNLPIQLNLCQLRDLSLSNPAQAQTLLTEVRQEVENQLHKARMLRQLYLQQL